MCNRVVSNYYGFIPRVVSLRYATTVSSLLSQGSNLGKVYENIWVYILASKLNKTLYTGVINNLIRRVYTHQQKLIDGFTKKYNVSKLVHMEQFTNINQAIHREKCIKRWKRA